MRGGVRDDVGQRREDAPLHEPQPRAAEAEAQVPEQRPVRHDGVRVPARRQARADQQVGDGREEQQHEADDARAPREPEPRQHRLQEDGEQDPADGAGGRGEARGEAAPPLEEVRDHAVCGHVEQGAAEAAEHGVG